MIALALLAAALAPAGPWSLSHDDRSCAISRPFGPDGATTLLIERRLVDRGWTLKLSVPAALPPTVETSLDLALDLPGGATTTGATALTAPPPARGALSASLPKAWIASAPAEATLTVASGGQEIARLALVAFKPALDALEDCRRGLLKAAGVGADAQSVHLPIFAHGGNYVGYPRDALARGAEGETIVAARIASGGMLVDCRVIAPAGDPSLDAHACERLRLDVMVGPPLHPTGAPQPHDAVAEVNWRLK